jgi:hypothetical protein
VRSRNGEVHVVTCPHGSAGVLLSSPLFTVGHAVLREEYVVQLHPRANRGTCASVSFVPLLRTPSAAFLRCSQQFLLQVDMERTHLICSTLAVHVNWHYPRTWATEVRTTSLKLPVF